MESVLFVLWSKLSFLRVFCKYRPFPYPGTSGFLSPRGDKRRERKKQREKTSGSGRCESHYHATIGVTRID